MSTTPSDDIAAADDMPAEVDFAAGVRGRFFRAEAQVKLPADDANQGIEPTGADQ